MKGDSVSPCCGKSGLTPEYGRNPSLPWTERGRKSEACAFRQRENDGSRERASTGNEQSERKGRTRSLMGNEGGDGVRIERVEDKKKKKQQVVYSTIT